MVPFYKVPQQTYYMAPFYKVPYNTIPPITYQTK